MSLRTADDKRTKAIGGIVALVITIAIILTVVIAGVSYYYYTNYYAKQNDNGTPPLLLFSADAYTNESGALEKAFNAQSEITISTSESAGSSALAANIKAGAPVSVFLSVSRTSVENTSLGAQYPGWAVTFAGDEMSLAFSPATNQSSAGKGVLSSFDNAIQANTTLAWHDFFNNLTSGSVKVGISNPNADPAGYRAWLVLELAGLEYANGDESYFVNRMLSNSANVTGASAAALVAPLDTGNIQFLFIYRSDIAASGLGLLQLTNFVNLGAPSYNSFYSKVNYTISQGLQKGSAIQLWLSVPKDSINPRGAVNFVAFVVQNYQTILSKFELVSYNPPKLYNDTSVVLPSSISSLINEGALVSEGLLS
jgi:molybdate/tungstate transport system substrate-binding protein